MRKKVNKKLIVALLSFVLLFGGTFGSSLAWLLDTSEDVNNVFTTSDINIELKESKLNDDGTLDVNTPVDSNSGYKMIPGWTINKDPKVTVKKDSVACWLFVKVVETGGVVEYLPSGADEKVESKWSDFLSYTVSDTGISGKTWKELTGDDAGKLGENEHVYFVEVTDVDSTTKLTKEDITYSILKDNKVSVKDSVTKEMMNALTAETYPKLTFTAYAVQYNNSNNTHFAAEEAWKQSAGYVALDPVTP